MGKYKQWLHHQEVGARLRDEIAAYEAERERVLKLAPNRAAPLPDLSNPIIAALLGHGLLSQAPVEQVTKNATNGTNTTTETTETVVAAAAEAAVVTEQSAAGEQVVEVEQQTEVVISKSTTQATRSAAHEEVKPTKAATGKQKAVTASSARQQEKRAEPAAAPSPAAPPDTIDPLLDALLARAESEPDDPLEALTALANRGPDLTRGEPPTPLPTLTTPASNMSPGETALNALLNQSKAATNPLAPATTSPLNPPAGSASGGQGTAPQAAQGGASAKDRIDTDELIAARPKEGYTEPRLAVPWWLRSVELGQEAPEGEKTPGTPEETESKQRLSVSLPFENEEDMRLHESVERWWQRWRQQN